VIVGIPRYDNGQADEGRAVAYYGSSTGLANAPGWVKESNQIGAQFGFSVSTAGDTNGDGYSDVIVGAPFHDDTKTDEGRAYVFNGSASGVNAGASNWNASGGQQGGHFGASVATAGDVYGDGFAAVVVGAPFNTVSGLVNSGVAYVYRGTFN